MLPLLNYWDLTEKWFVNYLHQRNDGLKEIRRREDLAFWEVMVGCEDSIYLEAPVRGVDMVSPKNKETGDLKLNLFNLIAIAWCGCMELAECVFEQ